MSRYRRVDISAALDPLPSMRVYGRTMLDGRAVVVVVKAVERGNVYYRRRVRGQRGMDIDGWEFARKTLQEWRAEVVQSQAVRVLARRMEGRDLGGQG